ncbi:MAG: class F sortase [Austwickia sp.]|jgi:hypothetical protein|nr:MAG: class F sortase [Austwickia sp.]
MGPALLRTDSPAAARASRADGRGGASRWRSVLAVLLVLLVAAGVALLWRGVHPQAPPEAPLPTYQFDQRAQPAPAPAPSPAPVPAYGPDRLGIPSLDIDAPLVPESVGAGGDLVIPGDPATVGRWREGPGLDAATGTTLLAGHVSVAGVGDGALHALHRIEPGALVVTTDAAGRALRWRIDGLVVHGKDALPSFPTDGPRRLAIVTCGGPLLRTAEGNTYRDNVIAYASPYAGPTQP